MLKEQDRDLESRVWDAQRIYDKAERSLSWAQSTQQSRGVFKKLLHGASDQTKVDELTWELEQAQQVYEDISQQHDALAAELEAQKDTVERLRERDGELEDRMGFLDSMLFLTENGTSPFAEDQPDSFSSSADSYLGYDDSYDMSSSPVLGLAMIHLMEWNSKPASSTV